MGVEPAAVAVQFIFSNPCVDAVAPGSARVSHIDRNFPQTADGSDLVIPSEVWERLIAEGRNPEGLPLQRTVACLSGQEASRSCPSADGHPETMKMIPLLIKEGLGVVDLATHHPLPLLI